MIQAETGGDLFEIEPATPYTDDYDTLLDVAQQEQADNARPELAAQVENWDSYDVVFVGYPDWWSDAPMLIYSFLEAYDWEGKNPYSLLHQRRAAALGAAWISCPTVRRGPIFWKALMIMLLR